MQSALILAQLAGCFLGASDCHTLRHGGIRSSPPLLSVIMKFSSSVPWRRLKNIKDVALLSTPDEVIHPCRFNLPPFSLNFDLCCVSGPRCFCRPSPLDILLPLNKCIAFIRDFFPPDTNPPPPSKSGSIPGHSRW